MTDPTEIRSIAVHREDVATALEATLRSERDVVLRLTPPFSGRMRARIHDRTGERGRSDESGPGTVGSVIESADADDDNGGAAIHITAAELVADPPAYPEPDETLAELDPSGSEGYDVEEHRERHTAAVEEWRETVAASIVDRIDLPVDDRVGRGEAEPTNDDVAHEVDVLPLG